MAGAVPLQWGARVTPVSGDVLKYGEMVKVCALKVPENPAVAGDSVCQAEGLAP